MRRKIIPADDPAITAVCRASPNLLPCKKFRKARLERFVAHVREGNCAERQNLTMRMGMRPFTRLTNAFSKKIDNHASMVAIHFLYYKFARIHKTLRITPAMAAALADHVLAEIVRLAD